MQLDDFGFGGMDFTSFQPPPTDYVSMGGGAGAAMPDTGWWSGFKDIAGDVLGAGKAGLSGLGSLAKSVLPLAQIGGGIAGGIASGQAADAARTQAKTQSRAVQQQLAGSQAAASTAAAPLTSFGQTQLTQAQAGKLDPGQEAEITRWTQAAKAHIRDYFARNGIADSDMLAREENEIDAQAEAMRGQMLAQMEAGGVGALTAGGGILTGSAGAAGGAASSAGAQEQQLNALIAAANKSLSELTAGAS